MTKLYRAMCSIAGGPYDPAGDWTEDKAAAVDDAQSVRAAWGSTRTDSYIDEKDSDPLIEDDEE